MRATLISVLISAHCNLIISSDSGGGILVGSEMTLGKAEYMSEIF